MAEKPVQVLVVDDEKHICDLFKRLLTLKGFDVTTTLEGIEAVAIAKKPTHFDVVLFDLRMPKMDGLEVIKNLKPLLPKAKFLLMTGYAEEAMIEETLKEGALFVLHKPFDINEVMQRIKEAQDITE
jgi:CheY-like chemotaxis protein